MDRKDEFERIVAALNEAVFDDARWPETSALIDEAIGAKGGILTFGDASVPANAKMFFARTYCRGVDRSALQREYFRDYYAEDEHIPRLRALPSSRIVPTADLFSERELLATVKKCIYLLEFGGVSGSAWAAFPAFCLSFAPRRRRRSVVRAFWRSSASLRR